MKRQYGDLAIREAGTEDAEQLCRWWNDGAVMAHAGFPNGLGTTTEAILQQLEKGRNRNHIILCKDVPIGEMSYRPMEDGVCAMGIKICDFSMQNKGYGKIILSLFIDGLFDEYGYQKIVLDTNLKNIRAQHVYEQLGFQKVRINENSWKDQLGVWQSSVDYALTRDTFVSFIPEEKQVGTKALPR